MRYLEDMKRKKIYNIISIVKLVSLLFCYIIVYNRISTKNIYLNMNNAFPNVFTVQVLICSIILIYIAWSFFSVKILNFRNTRTIEIVENFIFIALYSVLDIMCRSSVSEYKFMFLFIIITATLQLGIKHGMITALVSAVSVLVIDLIYVPVSSSGVNFQFQNDLIVAAVYVLTAWPLGHYVEIEDESIRKKNIELENLNSKINIQDIKRKRIEDMILKNKACYNLLIENSRDSIIVHRFGKIIFLNESAAKIIGISQYNSIKDISMDDIIPKDNRELVNGIYNNIYIKKKTNYTFDQEIVDINGNMLSIRNTSTYFTYEGKPTVLTRIHDISSEKQIQKLEKDVQKSIKLLNESRELNKLITEFLSNVSHELKTPLNVIFSAVQVLDMNDDLTSKNYVVKEKKYLQIVKQNCYRLMRLIENLLDVTKLNSGFLKLSLHNSNIVSFVENITQSIVPYLDEKGIQLIFDTDTEEKIVAIDTDKMERIVLNLLSNSIKFTDKGGKIFVNIVDENDHVLIKFKDTGIGIPQDKIKLIFERFGQINKSLRRPCEGSGIGLYLVKSFVELHGGTIDVKSKLGVGSEFIVNLPAKNVSENHDEIAIDSDSSLNKINMEFSDIYF
ncbi:sensor histidine kinase [Clostridium tyrobutyricum]|uniref:sensor histidine kinase n=1 Tax=Clostridium tyrobutyricum TaxID=1519 RepID=UPI0035D932EE